MAELVLSSILDVICDKLVSAACASLENLAPYNEIDSSQIQKLQRSLTQIQDLLLDASHKEITNHSVKRWLHNLQHLAYDIDDVLDDLATEAMHRDEAETHTSSKVRKLFSNPFSKHSLWTNTIKEKINVITTKLQDLIEDKATLGLIVKEETKFKTLNRSLQTSMVDVSSIVGRQAEKEALVQQLLGDGQGDQGFSVVPIVGMGGVGKTTLARLLYNEKQVKDHFQFKAWVCVSDEFDGFGISKVIFQSVAGIHKEFADLNLLQVDLENHLRGKRFLLVLDDVWSESFEDWKTLVGPFHACAHGSKIIMTTRKEQLLNKLGFDNINKLFSLSHDDALSLFALHALGVKSFDSHLSLKPHGEAIVKKCDGLPLALIALGTSLRTKKDEDSWREVVESEIWMSKDDVVVPALRISYHDLSARLKQLFAYCSLFPKDFLFDKEELVLLWIAEGFLHQSTTSTSTDERLGHGYFDELLARSFFQCAPNNESLFVMHDLMNDLATSVANEFFVRLGNETRKGLLEKYRHMSFVREEYVFYHRFETLTRAKSLRTFLATSAGEVESWRSFFLSNKILVDLISGLPLLRVLSLSYSQISEIPDSIGTLRQLRYLNLSRTRITHLPEKVCSLYNLHTLILFGCSELTELPNNFLKLKNLRHLDVRETRKLNDMPLGISELKSLQTLSKIIIGGKSGFEITKLKDFENLCGKVSITGLEKVHSAIDARAANFSQKRLSEFEVAWSDLWDGSRNEVLEKDVLNELKPRNDKLIQLKIRSYGGLEFPTWVGDPLFLHLKHVSISGCRKCTSLPPLAQLPSLKELFFVSLYEVKVAGMELLGDSVAFHSLEILSFAHMHGWKKWSMNTRDVFPCLKKLLIGGCPDLVEVTLDTLPSLNVLEIADCPSLVEVGLQALPSLNVLQIVRCDNGVLRRLVQVASAVTKLEIKSILGLNDVVWRGVVECLVVVEELSIWWCNEIRYLWESEAALVKLRDLKVYFCDNLVSLREKEEENNCRSNLLTSLRMLEVYGCNNMERCTCPDSIETLRVLECNSITAISLPTGGQRLKVLEIIGCSKLLERQWGGKKIKNNTRSMPMLEYVRIIDWSNLKSIVDVLTFDHLTTLKIINCESLESFPNDELPNLTSLKELEITNCPSMDACGVWPPNLRSLFLGKLKKPVSDWGPQKFPTSLVDLNLFGGEDGVSCCSQLSYLLPSSLTSLKIYEFKKLEIVSTGLQHLTSLRHLHFYDCANLNELANLQHLTSLQHLSFVNCPKLNNLSHPQQLTSLKHLSFRNCPNMMDLPKTLFPSLLSLEISECPNLKEKCSKRGCYWPLISHIPCIDT